MKHLRIQKEACRGFMLMGGSALALAALLSLAGCSIFDGFASESSAAHTVSTAEGLFAWNKAAQSNPGISCILADDIDMSGYEWTPVGTEDSPYTGTFDGQGHVISGVTIYQTAMDYVGLFGYVGSAGAVKNVALEEASVYSQQNYVGAVAGYNSGVITSCYVADSNVMGIMYVGGFVGWNSGVVMGCYVADSSVMGAKGGIGGFVGHVSQGTVASCYSSAVEVIAGTTSAGYGGVFVGNHNGYNIVACYYDSSVSTLNGSSPTNGYGYVSSSVTSQEITAVDGSNTTWDGIIDTINVPLAGFDFEYEDGGTSAPTLTTFG